MSDDIVTEVVEGIEDLVADVDPFPPRPGGLVDTARKRMAAQAAQAEQDKQAAEQVEERAVRAVKVAQVAPEVLAAQTLTIAAGGQAMILPGSPYRYRAVVSVVTAASTVILAKDSSQALGQAGFTLPAGIVLPLHTRAQVFAYNPGGSAVQVSVLAELYAPETLPPARSAGDKR